MRNDFCSNFLEHSARGTTWKNAKYVAKVKLSSGKYFYFYDVRQYQNYLKRRNQVGSNKAQAELSSQPAKRTISSTQGQSSTKSGSSLNGYSSKTTEEKKKVTADYINIGKTAAATLSSKASNETVSSGKTKAQELLERARAKSDSSSKKSGSSSSSGSSSKSKTSGSKSNGGSSSKSKTSKESKASSKQAKEKTVKETANKTKTAKADSKLKVEERPFTADSLKKIYGIKYDQVNKHESKEKMLEAMKSYKDGSFGYIMAGNKTYKWTKEDGKIVFKDFDTDKEVSLPSALNDIQEFRTDKGKKNKK